MPGAMFKTELVDFSVNRSSSLWAGDIAKVFVILPLFITRIDHFAKGPSTRSSCLGLCTHINH